MARTTPPGARRRETINGVTIEMLGIAHPATSSDVWLPNA
jgi:hypothetical protein